VKRLVSPQLKRETPAGRPARYNLNLRVGYEELRALRAAYAAHVREAGALSGSLTWQGFMRGRLCR
jgi:hypothetical protein